jgi:hypothetical protein
LQNQPKPALALCTLRASRLFAHRSGTVASAFLVAGICLLILAGGIAMVRLNSIRWITEV